MRTLLIDDMRDLNTDVIARTYQQGIKELQVGHWDILYLDHDIGACEECLESGAAFGDMTSPETQFYNTCKHWKTGYDILLWLEQNRRYLPGQIVVVSMNPVGRKRMEEKIKELYK